MVNEVGTRALRPGAAGSAQNAFLASDYVKTYTDLATMEGANEAARRAVNAILVKEGRNDLCLLFPLQEPLGFLRDWDEGRFRRGQRPSPLVGAMGVVFGIGIRIALWGSQLASRVVGLARWVAGSPPRPGQVVHANVGASRASEGRKTTP